MYNSNLPELQVLPPKDFAMKMSMGNDKVTCPNNCLVESASVLDLTQEFESKQFVFNFRNSPLLFCTAFAEGKMRLFDLADSREKHIQTLVSEKKESLTGKGFEFMEEVDGEVDSFHIVTGVFDHTSPTGVKDQLKKKYQLVKEKSANQQEESVTQITLNELMTMILHAEGDGDEKDLLSIYKFAQVDLKNLNSDSINTPKRRTWKQRLGFSN